MHFLVPMLIVLVPALEFWPLLVLLGPCISLFQLSYLCPGLSPSGQLTTQVQPCCQDMFLRFLIFHAQLRYTYFRVKN